MFLLLSLIAPPPQTAVHFLPCLHANTATTSTVSLNRTLNSKEKLSLATVITLLQKNKLLCSDQQAHPSEWLAQSQLVSYNWCQKSAEEGETEAVWSYLTISGNSDKLAPSDQVFGCVRCGWWTDNWSLCLKIPWGWKSGRFDCSVAPCFHSALWCVEQPAGLILSLLDWSC